MKKAINHVFDEIAISSKSYWDQFPNWQKQLIDERLKCIAQNPDRIRPIEELFDELDSIS